MMVYGEIQYLTMDCFVYISAYNFLLILREDSYIWVSVKSQLYFIQHKFFLNFQYQSKKMVFKFIHQPFFSFNTFPNKS